MKRFKILLPLCTLFLVFLNLSHSGCTKSTAETPIFPATYRYDAFEFKPSRFFVLTSATAHKEIPAAGNFLQYDQYLKEESDLESRAIDELPVQTLVIKDGSACTVSGTLPHNGMPFNLNATYTLQGNRLSVDLDTAGTIVYALTEDLSKGWLAFYSTFFTFKKDGETDYSPIYFDRRLLSTNTDSLVKALRTTEKLTVHDTIAFNFSGYRYVRQ